MKKILTAMALLLASVSLFAAKPLKVVSGSPDVLKQDVTATFTLDVSQASFENKKDFKSWSGADYDTYVQLMNDSFFQYFNKYSTGMKLVKEDAPYNVVLDIRLFEEKMGIGVQIMTPDGAGFAPNYMKLKDVPDIPGKG